ncbi:hypothetical protein C479_05058 [Halovivax asiaticus JCM 14624]|uniref:Uncharacterized protein n=1 Tax=Halovivax asiaticus JCM 14624 TaxID=1227490 RepID=M0BR40_9EURY|nr:hypothetical protein [Halovivax asiaticus]ELZ12149.1 hypothetical protein C479_05058 [Halovivax asiaticus JCM 14624]
MTDREPPDERDHQSPDEPTTVTDHDGDPSSESTARAAGRFASRRSVLASVGSVAGALGLTRVLGVDRVLDPPEGTVSVETALVHPGPGDGGIDPSTIQSRTRTVPADWRARVEAAFDLHERLLATRLPGYLNSAVVPGSYEDGTARISIHASPDELGAIPRTIGELVSTLDIEWHGIFEGIGVRVTRTEVIDDIRDADVEREDHLALGWSIDPVPGGVRCQTGGHAATLTPALYDVDGNPTFGTALHAFRDTEQFHGTAITVPIDGRSEPETVGLASTALTDSDVAIGTPTNGHTPGSVLGNRGQLTIRGQLTRWGLADRVARGVTLAKVGGSTGYTSGPIHGIDAATCVTADGCRLGQVTWGNESTLGNGDSGSVTVDPDPAGVDGALVASVNSARTWWPGQNHCWGIAAHALTSAHGYHF